MTIGKKNKELEVLVIEDNETFRKLAIDMLHGYVVHSAVSAVSGLAKFKKYNPDITFIDIGLPDGSGINIVKDIKSLNPNAFMVMLTASNLQKDVKDSLKNGARGYIVKPFSRQKIKECVEQYNSIADKLTKTKPANE